MTGNIPFRRGAATAIGLIAFLTMAPTGTRPAQAYALEGPIWGTKTARFDYIIPGTYGTGFSIAMGQAMQEWNPVSQFKWTPVKAASDPCAASGPGGAALRPTVCGQAFGSGTLAVTMYSYTSANRMLHAGTVFNSHVNFSVYTGALKPNTTDFKRVAVHELGHALGLDHEYNPRVFAIMSPTVSNIQKPQPDDIAGVRAMYGQ